MLLRPRSKAEKLDSDKYPVALAADKALSEMENSGEMLKPGLCQDRTTSSR